MSGSCCDQVANFEGLSPDYKRRLWLVIAINATMFLVEMAAGTLAGSQALQADALDFLGDATTYAISLAVIGTTIRIRARAAIEGAKPHRDGPLGLGFDCVSCFHSGRAARRNNGNNRGLGVGRQRGKRPHSGALQRWRCQRAFRLAVFTE
jgi:Cation efflux family